MKASKPALRRESQSTARKCHLLLSLFRGGAQITLSPLGMPVPVRVRERVAAKLFRLGLDRGREDERTRPIKRAVL